MALTKLYKHAGTKQLRVAGFMSGSGTNLIKIIEHEQRLKQERGNSPFHIPVIFSDNHKSRASEIGANFSIPVFIYDMDSFYKQRGKPLKDRATREEYEQECLHVLTQFQCPVAAYAGYMRKATPFFVNTFLGVNVHPADLTLKCPDGKPKYRGDHVVKDAIQAGEKSIRSTTHLVTEKVDCGPVLMVSKPLEVHDYDLHEKSEDRWNKVASVYQNRLKEIGDWIIFPRTLEYIADGRYARDEQGRLYFDDKEIPKGVRLE